MWFSGGATVKDTLLAVLKGNAGEYVSGEKLSRKLGVSRTAVWKHIGSLRDEGYAVESSPRLGYKLVSVPDFLLPAEISEGLHTAVLGKQIHYRAEIDSTNRLAKQLAIDGEPEGSVVLAEQQRTGRGRMGREWSSPTGGIWMSVILRPELAPYQVQAITLTAAVAAVEATYIATGVTPGIKWPNDLLLGKKKIAGILTEVSAEMERVNYLILGVGLNANIPGELFHGQLLGEATSLLAETGISVVRTRWVRSFLEKLEYYYFLALQEGFAEVFDSWRRYSITLGQPVTVRIADRTVTGIATDIDNHGALQLKTDAGIETFMAGEVSLKK
jgi:BirA family biotin operon repressor/biotin-[acetyl-CoA-carboxylase] ligase